MANVASYTALQVPFVDLKTGLVSQTWLYVLQQWQKQLAGGFDQSGNLKSDIEPTVGIVGRAGSIGAILGNISSTGVVDSAGLVSATDIAQGAVKLPAGATTNVLGSAAMQPSTAFDPAGSAATAQTNAESHADSVASTAQANAQAYSNAQLTAAFALGISVTITTAALTSTGTQGSMTFVNGLLTHQVQAT